MIRVPQYFCTWLHFWSLNFLVKHSVQKLSQKIAENSKHFNVFGLISDTVLLMFLYPFVYLATNFEIIQFENVTVCQRDCNQSIIFCIRTQKMVKELRFLLDKPSGLWLQNGSTLWQFCSLDGVETKIDHLLFISSFDQWIDLQDAIIGFEKNENMVIWKNVKDLYLGLFYSSTPFTNYTCARVLPFLCCVRSLARVQVEL